MARWYLRQLEIAPAQPDTTTFAALEIEHEPKRGSAAKARLARLVIYTNPEMEQLRQLVAGARARLAKLEVNSGQLETYHKLTAAINRAKDAGDIQTLREIANDPHGFILRQGWATLDFSDEAELAQLRGLHETYNEIKELSGQAITGIN